MPGEEAKRNRVCTTLQSEVKSDRRKLTVNIKGKEIGKGRPLVCVPIIEQTREAVLIEAEQLADQPADMIEWRMDWYENSNSPEELCRVTEKLADILKNKILLCTFRSKAQGGEKEISREDYIEMIQKLAQHGKADILDVEVCELEQPQNLIEKIQNMGAVVVASDHNFAETPSVEIMTEKLLYMKKLGADIAKLAVMPNNRQDVLKLLEATTNVKENDSEYPVITMSMGNTGMISRIAGQSFGSCVTFASAGKTSAPGQMPLEDMAMILNKISESMEE